MYSLNQKRAALQVAQAQIANHMTQSGKRYHFHIQIHLTHFIYYMMPTTLITSSPPKTLLILARQYKGLSLKRQL